MPQENCISKFLDIKDLIIENIEHTTKTIEISLSLEVKNHKCPKCGTITNKVHDYRIQKVRDLPILGKNVYWIYRKRRYRCPCCGKRFYEQLSLLPKRHRITNRTAAYCICKLREKRSEKDIAADLGVSASTVHRWASLLKYGKPKKLPRVVSIDEFRGNAGNKKFQCILTDAHHKQVIDILPDRVSHELSEYFRGFKNRNKVEYFVMDMNKVYLETARTFFPNAKIVIDRFHVSRYCMNALNNVRIRIQSKLLPQDRRYFKRSKKLLLSRKKYLSEENKNALSVMFKYSKDLSDAYRLKELFLEFMDANGRDNAKAKLKNFLLEASFLNIPEFESCITMLRNWMPYILNSFECHYSNGYTEGVNNLIKTIKRIAFGYRNFDNFRNRILHISKKPHLSVRLT